MKGPNQFRKKDLIIAAILIIIAGWIWYYSGRFPDLPEGYPGPKLFPRIIAIGLALIGMAIGIPVLLSGPKSDATQEATDKDTNLVRFILGVILMAAFPLISPQIGFVSALLAVGFLMGFVLQVKWWKALLTAAITTGGIYLIFAELLKVPL